jgi:hypothetical protein
MDGAGGVGKKYSGDDFYARRSRLRVSFLLTAPVFLPSY